MKNGNNSTSAIRDKNYAFYTGIALNFLFIVIEVLAGLYTDSLSLLTDAAFNLTNVASITLSLLAYRLMKVKLNDTYTYGYQKTTILVALFNAVVLLVSIGAIIYETLHRFRNPEPLPGETIAIVAAIGIAINTISALLFWRNRERDINVKSAFTHLTSDALVSFAVVAGGITMYYKNWYFIDAVLSILIAVIIIISTWRLLKNSVRLSLYGIPHHVDINAVKAIINDTRGVINVHHIHIWGLSTSMNALTAHIVVEDGMETTNIEKVKETIKLGLKHANIHHATLEFEPMSNICKDDLTE
ncbi:MAG TPA: cation diffusion facilitator family transporter [Panacibacter sp.]|nr:cation diffusion facilitator family transporter [Panacibacter sp.]